MASCSGMNGQTAFRRGISSTLQVLLPGREQAVLATQPEPTLQGRIEILAGKSTEGELTDEERAEYEGYMRANRFVAILRREARCVFETEAPNTRR